MRFRKRQKQRASSGQSSEFVAAFLHACPLAPPDINQYRQAKDIARRLNMQNLNSRSYLSPSIPKYPAPSGVDLEPGGATAFVGEGYFRGW